MHRRDKQCRIFWPVEVSTISTGRQDDDNDDDDDVNRNCEKMKWDVKDWIRLAQHKEWGCVGVKRVIRTEETQNEGNQLVRRATAASRRSGLAGKKSSAVRRPETHRSSQLHRTADG
jgi:hypothetical protein